MCTAGEWSHHPTFWLESSRREHGLLPGAAAPRRTAAQEILYPRGHLAAAQSHQEDGTESRDVCVQLILSTNQLTNITVEGG